MEFYDVINSRRTIRDFKSQSPDLDTVKRILSAGLKAPTNDHMRDWEFVVLTDKNVIAAVIKKIPKKVSAKRVDFILNSWRLTNECQRNMYIDGIPKQYEMLSKSSCLILPLFKQKKNLLEPENLSALNGFASIWCCIENILLAAAAEGLGCAIRIPSEVETEHVVQNLKLPGHYMLPCYLAAGYPEENKTPPEQIYCDITEKIHLNGW